MARPAAHDATDGAGDAGPAAAVVEPILSVRGLGKTFGSMCALDGVSLDVLPGEVHALLGHNGSGKSTLIKLLSGYHAPDAGTVAIRGDEVALPLPASDQQRLGVRFVHQDLGLVPTLSVLENLRVGRFATGFAGRIAWRDEHARARDLLQEFDVHVDPSVPVADLSETERAIVALVRGLQDMDELGSGLLVLDEPTASLPQHEVHHLFEAVRRATGRGWGVLFVSHRVDEVLTIADRASVLREGRLVATERVSDLDEEALVRLIVGRDIGELYPDVEHTAAGAVIAARQISGAVVRGASFEVREGEILGVTGLRGAGHDEVPYLLFGAEPLAGGAVVDAGGAPLDPSPEASLRVGISLLPADRLRLAGIPGATVRENITLATLDRYRRLRGLDRARERRDAVAMVERVALHPKDPEANLARLSGGNQQKALLGRSLLMDLRVLLLHEPTQGVDIGARQTIFQVLQDAAAAGTAVVYASVEYEDLAHLCDRVLVFRGGRIATELRGAALSSDAILNASYRS